jgi:hypothetical protein
MIEYLSVMFERLLSAGLKLKPKKCALFAIKVEYLGHVVSEIIYLQSLRKLEL